MKAEKHDDHRVCNADGKQHHFFTSVSHFPLKFCTDYSYYCVSVSFAEEDKAQLGLQVP